MDLFEPPGIIDRDFIWRDSNVGSVLFVQRVDIVYSSAGDHSQLERDVGPSRVPWPWHFVERARQSVSNNLPNVSLEDKRGKCETESIIGTDPKYEDR